MDLYNFYNSEFSLSLKSKHKKIKDQRIILFMKHIYLKKIVNLFQISIIIASTIITFIESIKQHVYMSAAKIQLFSISLSTYIAIFTAIFKFLKIDDKKEEIYKVLQIFNDIESVLVDKIKQINQIQNRYKDEILFLETNKIFVCDISNQLFTDISSNIINYKNRITIKYNQLYERLIDTYNNEAIDNKIQNAKKAYHSIFSYNEIIYYRGKIVESMLLDKLHVANRTILEIPIQEYKTNCKEIHALKQKIKMNDISNTIIEMEDKIKELKKRNKQMFDENEMLYENNFCNNICLYFSNICYFFLIMKLYINLAFKRKMIRDIKNENYVSRGCCFRNNIIDSDDELENIIISNNVNV